MSLMCYAFMVLCKMLFKWRYCILNITKEIHIKVWIIGLGERATSIILIFQVDHRNAETLIPKLLARVKTGSLFSR